MTAQALEGIYFRMTGILIRIDSRYCVRTWVVQLYHDFGLLQALKAFPYRDIRFFLMAILTRSGSRWIFNLAMMLYLWDSTVLGLMNN